MQMSDLIATLETAMMLYGDEDVYIEYPYQLPEKLVAISTRKGRGPLTPYGVTLTVLADGAKTEPAEADMATIFGRRAPLPDRDPTAPHDEPPMMVGG